MEVRRRSASTTTTVSAPVNVGTPPRSPKEAAASVAALCYGFPKDLKDSLNALQADRAVLAAQPPSSRPLTPDNRLLNKEASALVSFALCLIFGVLFSAARRS
ncbi:hypothetical protein HPB47_009713 [Ixodes persulcatus]|uniref:Uncharacterized protein n=1 Tax=Ixodes persulcatus TaxID=34615 RepID=A0AC60P197_IXOPE|nr:hypothetical protein HPB47_009713 [Ixodes persulcatus]